MLFKQLAVDISDDTKCLPTSLYTRHIIGKRSKFEYPSKKGPRKEKEKSGDLKHMFFVRHQ